MNTAPFFSLIIPVYNVEKYLKQCLDSILEQAFKDYELILVNDGSTDCSGSICDSYANKYPQIIVVHKINGGQSTARNIGLDKSKGKYIWFIDSDDWIYENSLSILKQNLENQTTEVVSFSYKIYFEDTKKYSDVQYLQSISPMSGSDFLSKVKNYYTSACMYIYSTSFLKNSHFQFKEGIIHEDTYFNLSCILHVKKIEKIPNPLYFRRIRKGSITTDFSTDNLVKRILSYIQILELCYRLQDKNETFMNRNINLYKITLFEVLYEYTLRNIKFKTKYNLLKKAKKAIIKIPVSEQLNLINFLKFAFNRSIVTFYVLRIVTSKLYKLKRAEI